MITLTKGDYVIDMSPDLLEQMVDALRNSRLHIKEEELDHVTKTFFFLDLEDIIWMLGQRGINTQSVRALAAHGNSFSSGRYAYVDRYKKEDVVPFRSVQDWISRYDGKHDVLLVYSCNPKGAKLTSESSILVYIKRGIFTSELIKDSRYDKNTGLLFQMPNQ